MVLKRKKLKETRSFQNDGIKRSVNTSSANSKLTREKILILYRVGRVKYIIDNVTVGTKVWMLALVSALLKTWLDFFHGGMEQDRKLETQGQTSTPINLATPQSPMCGSLVYFPPNFVEDTEFHQQHLMSQPRDRGTVTYHKKTAQSSLN